jgi:hypothetical protein
MNQFHDLDIANRMAAEAPHVAPLEDVASRVAAR